jgi:hypothetical protein
MQRPGNKIVINACVLYSACHCLSFFRLLKINLAPVASHAAAPAAQAHATSRADTIQRAAAFLGLLEECADAENLDKAMVRFQVWGRMCSEESAASANLHTIILS